MATGDAAIVPRSLDSERALIAGQVRILGHDAESVRAELAEAFRDLMARLPSGRCRSGLLSTTREDPAMTNTSTETPITQPAPDEVGALVGTKMHFLHGGLSLDTSPAGSG